MTTPEAVFCSLALVCATLVVLAIVGAVVRHMDEQSDDDDDPPAGGFCAETPLSPRPGVSHPDN